MEEFISHLSLGFGVALLPQNIFYCFVGALLGTVIGVMPGLGPITAIAILLPLTYDMEPTTAVIMLCGMYYGATYGGSTTSILINTPGEASATVTCLDGYQMAKQGRAKSALATAAIGSFFGGTVATVALMLISPLVASFAIRFAPPEYFALMLLALTMVSGLATGSPLKGFISTFLGLLLSMVGLDAQTGAQRFVFDRVELLEGVDFITVAIGLFAISEVIISAGSFKQVVQERLQIKGQYWISWKELKQSFPAYLRGTILGFAIGALPGAGGTTSSFMSYAIEKKVSKHPETFGKGAIEGVAGPETANNAAHQAALVPLMTLGIPTSSVTALLLGAFMIYGLQPGPLMFEKNPEFVWGLFASMYVGNVILLILNLPLVNLFAKLLDLPGAVLYSMVIAFCVLGVYANRLSVFDVGVMLFFGVVGYYMRMHNYPLAPLLLALVLGDLMEQNFRRALTLAAGNPAIFFTRPITVVLMLISLLILVGPPLWSAIRPKKVGLVETPLS
ncbi:MAG TPA: tripartite tricarboxylate transporter permease [Chloroflexota bacterium]|nr:tripartite tricarboxylate transporter permease [Chloroflexota bacterium]